MKRRQLPIVLLLTVAMSLGLASCGSNDTTTKKHKENTDEDKETIVTETPDEPDKDAVLPISILTGDYSEQEWSPEYDRLLASVTYPVIALEDECAKAYPKLADALSDLSQERKTTQLEEYQDLLVAAQEQISYNQEYFFGLETSEVVYVRRADSKVTSLLFDGYANQGGAHGYPYFLSETYDTKTGQKLELTDVINDLKQLPDLVQEQLDTYYDPAGFYENMNLHDYFDNTDHEITWTLDFNGITFFFSPYELAPYAAGSQIVTITFDSHPEIFKKEYTEVPKNYGMEISSSTSYYYDLNGDGIVEQLSILGNADEYYECDQLCININDQSLEDTLGAFSMEAVLLHTANGKNYLYVESSSENDYRKLTVYDLSTGYAQKVDFVYAGFHTPAYDEENYYAGKQVLTNPEEFFLDTRTELLSTLTGYKKYSVGTNGLPVSDDEWYTFEHELTLTLLQPLEVSIIDEKTGQTISQKTLDAGTKVIYYRTDDESIADLKLPDGTIGRVTLDSKEWPRCIDNVSIEEIFDGLLFAG